MTHSIIKNALNAITFVVLFIISFAFSGCNENSDEHKDIINNDEIKDSTELDKQQSIIDLNAVCNQWGAQKSYVMEYMEDYTLKTTEDNFICYQNDIQTISYQFDNDALVASSVLILNSKVSLSELESAFNEYEHIGAKSGFDIYANEALNIMATISEVEKGDTTFFAVGYTSVNDETNK